MPRVQLEGAGPEAAAVRNADHRPQKVTSGLRLGQPKESGGARKSTNQERGRRTRVAENLERAGKIKISTQPNKPLPQISYGGCDSGWAMIRNTEVKASFRTMRGINKMCDGGKEGCTALADADGGLGVQASDTGDTRTRSHLQFPSDVSNH